MRTAICARAIGFLVKPYEPQPPFPVQNDLYQAVAAKACEPYDLLSSLWLRSILFYFQVLITNTTARCNEAAGDRR